MAALDKNVPQTYTGAAAIVVKDGSSTPLTAGILFEGSFSWTETGRETSEALNRGRRSTSGPPTIIEGDDGTITLSLSGLIQSYLGDSDTHIYEALTRTGNAAAWVRTANGTAHSYDLDYTSLSGDPSGDSQLLNFPYIVTRSLKIDPKGTGNKSRFEAELICHRNRPTIT